MVVVVDVFVDVLYASCVVFVVNVDDVVDFVVGIVNVFVVINVFDVFVGDVVDFVIVDVFVDVFDFDVVYVC